MAIIGISGNIGTGKNLVASIIQYWLWKAKVESAKDMSIHYTFKDFIDNEPLSDKLSGWKTVRFADKLKDIVCILLGCTREQLEDREFKEKELGEEWTRYCLENSYGSFMSIEIPDIEGTFGRQDYFFTDIRYSKEYWDKYLKGSKNSLGIQFIRKFKLTPRLLLQQIGTDLFRNQLHPNIWVNALFANYKPIKGHSHKIQYVDIIDNIAQIDLSNKSFIMCQKDNRDINYEDCKLEGNILKVYNTDKIGVRYIDNSLPNWIITDVRFPNELKAIKDRNGINIRVNRPYYDTSMKALVNAHESETALDNAEFDYTIDNDSTIEDLVVKVKNILLKERLL